MRRRINASLYAAASRRAFAEGLRIRPRGTWIALRLNHADDNPSLPTHPGLGIARRMCRRAAHSRLWSEYSDIRAEEDQPRRRRRRRARERDAGEGARNL